MFAQGLVIEELFAGNRNLSKTSFMYKSLCRNICVHIATRSYLIAWNMMNSERIHLMIGTYVQNILTKVAVFVFTVSGHITVSRSAMTIFLPGHRLNSRNISFDLLHCE